MPSKRYHLAALILLLFFFFSCGDDAPSDCDGSNFEFELRAEFDAISDAAIAYSSDPSSSNCNALKNAYRAYLDALRPYRNCAFNGTTRQRFDAELDAAEQAIDQFAC